MQPKPKEFLNFTNSFSNKKMQESIETLGELQEDRNIKYVQCVLQRKTINGAIEELVSYIPEKFARLNNQLRLRGIDGWKVTKIGATLRQIPPECPDYIW